MLQDIKDEILDTSSQLDDNPRYVIRDNNGNVVADNAQIELKTPRIEEGTPLNKQLFDTLQTKLIGYNVLDKYEDEFEYFATDFLREGKEVVFETATTKYPSADVLQNGNIFVAYVDETLKFKILDSNGETVKTFELGGYTATFNKVKVLPNGNVIVVYSDFYGAHANLFNQNGDMIGNKVTFSSTSNASNNAKYISVDILKNGNVVVAFVDGTNSNYPSFAIIGIEENTNLYIVKEKTVIYSALSNGITVSAMQNGNIFFAYHGGAGYQGLSYSIADENGQFVKGRTDLRAGSTSTSSMATLSSSVFDTGEILVAYGHTYQTGKEYTSCTLVSAEGSQVKGSRDLTTAFRAANVTTVKIPENKIAIVYTHNATTAGIYFAVINNANGIEMAPTRTATMEIIPSDMMDTVITQSKDIVSIFNGRTLAIAKGAPRFNRSYLIENLNEPLTGQVLKTWELDDTLRSEQQATNYSYVACKRLSNGNIARALVQSSSGFIEILSPTFERLNYNLFASSTVYDVYMDVYEEGGFVVAYRTNSSVITFTMFEDSGVAIRTVTWTSKYSEVTGCLILPNGNLLIVGSINNIGMAYWIYDRQGNLIKEYTALDAVQSANTSMAILKNGNIMIFFSASTYAIATVINQNGEIIKSPSKVATGEANTFTQNSMIVLDNSNVMIIGKIYKSGYGYPCYSLILDQDGNVVSEPDTVISREVNYLRAYMLPDGNILLLFNTTINSVTRICFMVIKQNLEIVVDITEFSSTYLNRRPNIFSMPDNNIVVEYSASEKIDTTTVLTTVFEEIKNIYLYNEDDIVSNSINEISVDTLINTPGFYELLYNGEKYIAKEVRI